MLRLFSTIRKELLILIRDRSGLAIMFLMPMTLVTIMALIQDGPFRDYQEFKIPLLLVNNDSGSLGKKIEDGLINSKIFEVSNSTKSEKETRQDIAEGKYDIGIIIPNNATDQLNERVERFVAETLNSVGISDTLEKENNNSEINSDILVYFAPTIKKSFKNAVLSSIKQVSSKLETQTLLDFFQSSLRESTGELPDVKNEIGDFVNFREYDATEYSGDKMELNSVQHNVPAWTLFGMFFIVITLAGSIIKEREDGSYLRILTMPGSYVTVMAGKVVAFLLVCLIQCMLMLLVGIYLMPILGLPELVIGSSIAAILLVALCSALAATGYGVMIGTFFNTHQQSSTFGAVSVVILAALGGIWVPVYVMPETIKILAEFSPLYWGLSAFHDVFLQNGTVETILPYAYKLLLFFLFTISIAYLFNKVKSN
ncbi:MAG: ABC transporter permease [Bacteroidetes bacterium]|nr:ABC transporter permease [Bacteroidota bacterium]HET6244617.1 ABC transporter permease [Bacteroidia bacterium]